MVGKKTKKTTRTWDGFYRIVLVEKKTSLLKRMCRTQLFEKKKIVIGFPL